MDDRVKPSGRPSGYSEKLAALICERVSNGEALSTVIAEEGMPSSASVYRWTEAHDSFREKLARAREWSAHILADRMRSVAEDDKGDFFIDGGGNPVADHVRVQRHRLLIDTYKFLAMKLLPRIYDRKPVDGSEAAAPGAITVTWLSTSSEPPAPPSPPKQLPYIKPSLPADLSPADWSVLVDLLELVRRTIPSNSDKPAEEIFGVMKAALLKHFAE
jgi:hypothetical protein